MDSLVRFFRAVGLPTAVALVLAVLVLENKPLSLKELSLKTGYTKGHLSYILRLLESKDLVERVYEKRRKLLVRAKGKTLLKLLKEHLDYLRRVSRDVLSELREELVSELKPFEEEVGKLLRKLEKVNNHEYPS